LINLIEFTANLQRIREEGHELGNHTMQNKTSLFLSSKELSRQILTVDAIIHAEGQPKMKWFRPGFGYYNARLLQVAKDCGYNVALGDVYPHDYYLPFPNLNAKFVMRKIKPGSVIILHDLDHCVETLEHILPALNKLGYAVTTLSSLKESEVRV
jgi:peptidoglycan/xylan/chitin deacetylase (PgdA/CDA1 family)